MAATCVRRDGERICDHVAGSQHPDGLRSEQTVDVPRWCLPSSCFGHPVLCSRYSAAWARCWADWNIDWGYNNSRGWPDTKIYVFPSIEKKGGAAPTPFLPLVLFLEDVEIVSPRAPWVVVLRHSVLSMVIYRRSGQFGHGGSLATFWSIIEKKNYRRCGLDSHGLHFFVFSDRNEVVSMLGVRKKRAFQARGFDLLSAKRATFIRFQVCGSGTMMSSTVSDCPYVKLSDE